MPNEIPHTMQLVIDERDAGHCMRCGGQGSARHHRRRRDVHGDGHTHEPCNVVTLCAVCHARVHAYPRESKAEGWIVKPWESPLEHHVGHYDLGPVRLECDGTYMMLGECEDCGEMRVIEAGRCRECLTEALCCEGPNIAALIGCRCAGGAALALQRMNERERVEV